MHEVGLPANGNKPESQEDSPTSSDQSGSRPALFDSYVLDNNSLRALHHDDEEDVMHPSSLQRKRNEPIPRKFTPGELCVVCGDAASGIHYSVSSCNGCKTFFRRVLIENRFYSCKSNGNCIIDKSMRCSCRHCRFKKCLDVGMDTSELNVERRRKRKLPETETVEESIADVEDELIKELLAKERMFKKMLISKAAPVHNNIDEGLEDPQSSFVKAQEIYEDKLALITENDMMTFSYWRSKILSTFIEYAKSFDEFQQLPLKDKKNLIVHSSFSNLVLSEAFHTPERYTDRIVFPDNLSGFRSVSSKILKRKTGTGLIPTVSAVINNILVPIRKMRMTEIEYVLLQAIIFFDRECISLSEKSVEIVFAKRRKLLDSLRRYLDLKYPKNESAYRFAALLLRISNVNKVAAFKRETLCTIETFNLMSIHSLTMEISTMYPEVSFF